MEQIEQENTLGHNFVYCSDSKPFPRQYIDTLKEWGFVVKKSVRRDGKRYMLYVEWKLDEVGE